MNDLEELKSLLFGAEKRTLDSLNERLQTPETRAADIADVLPEAVRLSHQKGDALVTELRSPVSECLKQSFREAPQEYADVLYPIMGPAIRKSIAHALKAFAQQINQTMENSLSAKGLAWRFQAARAGVPFSDFVMQRTLQYRVEQVYLISRENGLLMAHVHHDASRIKDSDAVSAMFTAIQDFVKESFSPDPNSRLETADMGEFTLWAVHGPHALMVCVIRGVPPKALRTELSAILERIHFRYSEALRSYAGDTSTVKDVESELKGALQFQALQATKKKSRALSLPLLIIILLALGLLAYLGYGRWQHQKQFQQLETVTANIPGIYVGNIEYTDGKFVLEGLRDPLAASVDRIALDAGLDPDQLEFSFSPYRSLDPEMMFRRALGVLDPPETVAFTYLDGGLTVTGRAPQHWIDLLGVKIDAGTVGIPVIIENLVSTDQLELEASAAKLNGAVFLFSAGTELIDDEALRLDSYIVDLKSLVDSASKLDIPVEVSIAGYTDGSGSSQYNAALSRQRASEIVNTLIAAGMDGSLISIQEMPSSDLQAARSASVAVRLRHQ